MKKRVTLVIRGKTIQRGSWLRVPKDWVDVEVVRDDLSIANAAYWSAKNSGVSTEGIDQTIYAYQEDGDYILVPRHYPVKYNSKGRAFLQEWGEIVRRVNKPVYDFSGVSHSIALRDQTQEESSEALQGSREDKILSLACGIGKTVVSLHAAVEQRLFPILVVVHTNALMDQWEREIKKFLAQDGRPVRVGRIQQSVARWKGYPIAIAMLHTLVKRKFEPEFYDYWQLMIGDEVHRLGAQTFMQACPMFVAERWGLSATLHRSDNMDEIIQLHLGQVAYQNLEQPLKPKVYFVNTRETINEAKFKNYRTGRMNLPKIINYLSDIDRRNECISAWIAQCLQYNRTILVLGERLHQLKWLFDRCQASSKALHVGQMKAEERRVALTKQVVFATQHLAKEGLDRPAFDTLFILYPFGGEGRARQSTGRILRIADGKKEPLVFVFVDQVGIMEALAMKMRRHFSKLDFSTRTVERDAWARERTKKRTG